MSRPFVALLPFVDFGQSPEQHTTGQITHGENLCKGKKHALPSWKFWLWSKSLQSCTKPVILHRFCLSPFLTKQRSCHFAQKSMLHCVRTMTSTFLAAFFNWPASWSESRGPPVLSHARPKFSEDIACFRHRAKNPTTRFTGDGQFAGVWSSWPMHT